MKYAVIFTGQGSQAVSMASGIIRKHPEAAALFKKADEILGFSLTDMCCREDKFHELDRTCYAQPAIFVTEYAVYRIYASLLEDSSHMPDFMAGHSLGEYTALAAGGALDFEQALMLVSKRAEAMGRAAEMSESVMAAAGTLSDEDLSSIRAEAAVSGDITLACDNSQSQKVYSMLRSDADAFIRLVRARGARAKLLNVEAGFHSSFMEPAAWDLQEALEGCVFHTASCGIYSNAEARIYEDSEEIAGALLKQLTHTVQWTAISRDLADKADMILEIGPRQVLAGEFKKIMGAERVRFIGPFSDLEKEVPETEALIDGGFRDDVKRLARSLICTRSDGSEKTLRTRERIYSYLLGIIGSRHIDAAMLAAANRECRGF